MTDDHNGPEQTFRDTERNLRDRIEELEAWKAAEEAHHHMLRQELASLTAEVERLREALRPFAFLEMEKDEGLADTQYVWETIYSDRVQDWFSYEEIETARAALERISNGDR